MKTKFTLLAVLCTALLLPACASNLSGESFSREEARAVQRVKFGTIEHLRPVVIEGTKTQIGTGAGAIIGGIAGSSVGEGKGSKIGSVLGAVAGGLVGAATEEAVTKKQGVEITVRLENGKVIAIVQQLSEDETLAVGDRVRVLKSKGVTRVSR